MVLWWRSIVPFSAYLKRIINNYATYSGILIELIQKWLLNGLIWFWVQLIISWNSNWQIYLLEWAHGKQFAKFNFPSKNRKSLQMQLPQNINIISCNRSSTALASLACILGFFMPWVLIIIETFLFQNMLLFSRFQNK